MLAHLGDAVFELYEREHEVMTAQSAETLHQKVVRRVNAESQAKILEGLMEHLHEAEQDLVRRARNLKLSGNRRADQTSYRYATAMEALVGYLYLTDKERLSQLLDLTRTSKP
jgi:ribonuclease-3 family protein